MARLIAFTAVILALALAACGGGNDSTATTPPDQTAIHWTRCRGADYGAAVAGISCHDAYKHIPIAGPDSGGSAGHIRASDPDTFTKQGFNCTQFPLENGSGFHVICNHGHEHLAFYLTP
jgi:hypothetical protein